MITSDSKLAVLSMDIEDWYHLDYFNENNCDRSFSYLDGIERYCDILIKHKVTSSFFVLAEIANSIRSTLKDIIANNYEIGSHGYSHIRPINLNEEKFYEEIIKSKKIIENIITQPVEGYRASCFSIDRSRLNKVEQAGFTYDSSLIDFSSHPLYETINMDGFKMLKNNIYRKNDFFEFQVNTLPILNKNIPISGGGYIRILPWFLSDWLIKKHLKFGGLYILYIHPFELSSKPNPIFPGNSKWYNKFRFSYGRSSVSKKLSRLITLLKDEGYSFTTFSNIRKSFSHK